MSGFFLRGLSLSNVGNIEGNSPKKALILLRVPFPCSQFNQPGRRQNISDKKRSDLSLTSIKGWNRSFYDKTITKRDRVFHVNCHCEEL